MCCKKQCLQCACTICYFPLIFLWNCACMNTRCRERIKIKVIVIMREWSPPYRNAARILIYIYDFCPTLMSSLHAAAKRMRTGKLTQYCCCELSRRVHIGILERGAHTWDEAPHTTAKMFTMTHKTSTKAKANKVTWILK